MSFKKMYDMLGGAETPQGLPIMVAKAATTLPQGGATAQFTVTGGNVELMSIVGEVTSAIANTPNATKLTFNPTGTGGSTDLCATLDIDNKVVGTLLGLSGDFSDAMLTGLWLLERTSTANTAKGIVVAPGTIDLDCVGSIGGETSWTLVYRPLEAGAAVVAA